MERTPTILVGFDGTPTAEKAVRFAAEEAARRQTFLRVVHVRERAEDPVVHMSTAVGIARGYVDPSRISTAELVGWPAALLVAEGADAELVVVGRGWPYQVGAALGSVAEAVVCNSHRPVIVLAGTDRSAADPDAASSGVVVGVKHIDAAEDVLTAGFAEAELRGCPLQVIHSWRHAGEHRAKDVLLPIFTDPIRYAEEVSDRLEDAVRLVADKYPEVPVSTAVPHAGAFAALMTAAEEAALLVVGTPRVGPVRGALLGSAGQAILRDGGCPVLFVPRPV